MKAYHVAGTGTLGTAHRKTFILMSQTGMIRKAPSDLRAQQHCRDQGLNPPDTLTMVTLSCAPPNVQEKIPTMRSVTMGDAKTNAATRRSRTSPKAPQQQLGARMDSSLRRRHRPRPRHQRRHPGGPQAGGDAVRPQPGRPHRARQNLPPQVLGPNSARPGHRDDPILIRGQPGTRCRTTRKPRPPRWSSATAPATVERARTTWARRPGCRGGREPARRSPTTSASC